jgi:Alw26I/Eco31I/Esp3I family type II restriction m6 adenine DNA methyltransferase
VAFSSTTCGATVRISSTDKAGEEARSAGTLWRRMPAPKEVADLVERFRRNRQSYEDPQYNETQTRVQFINPLFIALGWDIDNSRGYAEAYKDVVHEDSLKIGGATKAPDYSFRVGGTRKFFVEAKKPSINLKDAVDPAYQLRRYGWSAKLPISVLTNFSCLVVYDCRYKPEKEDKSSKGRLIVWNMDEYVDRWDEIAAIFSKESVLQGSFDRFVSSTTKRGTAEVDDEFLSEIEEWRLSLARNIAIRNRGIDTSGLNFSVQQTIDRIIFLRICEDRGIEPYGKLAKLRTGTGIYEHLKDYFKEADEKYNSGLFHFKAERGRKQAPDELTPSLAIDDKPLKEIFKRLYYPESPYEFSVISADILGQVYEQFLGKVIVLNAAGRASVEDKPEVKNAGGVFYTPTFVVHYIVKSTLGVQLSSKTLKTVKGLHVLDPSCGSGSFLLGAYQYLLDWYLAQYVLDGPEKHARGRKPAVFNSGRANWKLTTGERRRILLEHIYGVDIDSQAVEVTKLSLLLKVLESDSAESLGKSLAMFHERALPDLENNIKCGNSLISSDYYEDIGEAEPERVNAFDWSTEFPEVFQKGGFDVVVGNPPYDVLEKDRGQSSWPHMALAKYMARCTEYSAAKGGKLNLFRFFLVRSLGLARMGGHLGMIVPMSVLADSSTAPVRAHLLRNTTRLVADCFPQKDNANRRIFKRAKLSTVILTGELQDPARNRSPKIDVRVYPWDSFADRPRECRVSLSDANLLDAKTLPIPLVNEEELELCKRIHSNSKVRALAAIVGVTIARGEINQTIFRSYINSDPRGKRLLKGSELRRFGINLLASQGSREWFAEREFLTAHSPRPAAFMRRIALQRISGVDDTYRLIGTIVDPVCYFADSTNSIVVDESCDYSLEYILGLLNSRLMQWRFRLSSTNNNVSTGQLNALPLRLIDSTDTADQARRQKVVSLVKRLLILESEKDQARLSSELTRIARQVAAVNAALDRAIYDLYDLPEADIAIIEHAVGTKSMASIVEEQPSSF